MKKPVTRTPKQVEFVIGWINYATQNGYEIFTVSPAYQHAKRGTKCVLRSWLTGNAYDAWFWSVWPNSGQVLMLNFTFENQGYGAHNRNNVIYLQQSNIVDVLPPKAVKKYLAWQSRGSFLRARAKLVFWLKLLIYWLLVLLERVYFWFGFLIWKALYSPKVIADEAGHPRGSSPVATSKGVDLPGIGDIPVKELSIEQLEEILRHQKLEHRSHRNLDDTEDGHFDQ